MTLKTTSLIYMPKIYPIKFRCKEYPSWTWEGELCICEGHFYWMQIMMPNSLQGQHHCQWPCYLSGTVETHIIIIYSSTALSSLLDYSTLEVDIFDLKLLSQIPVTHVLGSFLCTRNYHTSRILYLVKPNWSHLFKYPSYFI